MSNELEAVLAVVRQVLEENHAYYMAHPDYPMPKPCMWPDELMGEIRASLISISKSRAADQQRGDLPTSFHPSENA